MAKNVHSIINELKAGLSDLQAHFEHLGSVFGGPEKTAPRGRKARKTRVRRAPRQATTAAPAQTKKTRKKVTISPARRAQMKLQGRYMALVRRLPKAKQTQVKKVRATKGYEAALKMM